ncbi:hypothetical protein F750_0013 [Streptomyces sp. PAMC 26508]|nr:hypothetical protein F750_0013 [Streptomyces sp. PAMC 26508]
MKLPVLPPLSHEADCDKGVALKSPPADPAAAAAANTIGWTPAAAVLAAAAVST